jgi:hypothetical protein
MTDGIYKRISTTRPSTFAAMIFAPVDHVRPDHLHRRRMSERVAGHLIHEHAAISRGHLRMIVDGLERSSSVLQSLPKISHRGRLSLPLLLVNRSDKLSKLQLSGFRR